MKPIALLACLAAGAGWTHAQRAPEETVVVTANAQPVTFENLARSVVILTRKHIARLPVHSVADLLRYAAGLEVRARGPRGVQANFLVRGAGFGQVLVLVNGVRLNNSQSGHHNSDIPVVLQDVERVEILYGPGSSLYGADAFGGTINIITRDSSQGLAGRVSGGDFGYVEASLRSGFGGRGVRQSVSATVNRSSGFAFNRDFRTTAVASHTSWGGETVLYFSHLNKAFGADNFYGASPSREETNATLLSLSQPLFSKGGWKATGRLFYRTHGDHFLWDFRLPGFFENRHRTHAAGFVSTAERTFTDQTRLAFGAEAGGDWIRSNNLGRHQFARTSLFAELQQSVGGSATIYPGLRYDRYSTFGSALSPSLSAAWWVAPTLKWRSSVGRAFRVPTFTELYYRDPAHQANSSLQPEKALGAETGLDWLLPSGWLGTVTLFSRWEKGVIDWVRADPTQQWSTTNIHRLQTRGLELALQRAFDSGIFAQVQYAYLNSTAGSVPFLSKYVLDFARHSYSAAFAVDLPADLTWGQRIDYRRRADGRSYWLVDCRLSRDFGPLRLFAEGTNLLNTHYQEIRPVDMPGRWLSAGLELRVR